MFKVPRKAFIETEAKNPEGFLFFLQDDDEGEYFQEVFPDKEEELEYQEITIEKILEDDLILIASTKDRVYVSVQEHETLKRRYEFVSEGEGFEDSLEMVLEKYRLAKYDEGRMLLDSDVRDAKIQPAGLYSNIFQVIPYHTYTEIEWLPTYRTFKSSVIATIEGADQIVEYPQMMYYRFGSSSLVINKSSTIFKKEVVTTKKFEFYSPRFFYGNVIEANEGDAYSLIVEIATVSLVAFALSSLVLDSINPEASSVWVTVLMLILTKIYDVLRPLWIKK